MSLYEKRQKIFGYFTSSSRLPQKVAVKIFMSCDSFSRELKHMSKIGANSSQNIVRFFGACTVSGEKKGLVMDAFDTDLMEYITPPCSLPEGKSIMWQAANGLKHLKKLKIVHRDIKPENILVRTLKNGIIEVALTDLGVSKHMTATQRSDQTNIGTHLWMAPEVRGGRPRYGHPADVFGFGLTAMYVFTGEFPMGGDVEPDALSQWVDQCLEDAKLLRHRDLCRLLKTCLEYYPTRRISKDLIIEHKFFQDGADGGVFMELKNGDTVNGETRDQDRAPNSLHQKKRRRPRPVIHAYSYQMAVKYGLSLLLLSFVLVLGLIFTWYASSTAPALRMRPHGVTVIDTDYDYDSNNGVAIIDTNSKTEAMESNYHCRRHSQHVSFEELKVSRFLTNSEEKTIPISQLLPKTKGKLLELESDHFLKELMPYVVAPEGYDRGVCDGKCNHPDAHVRNHAVIQNYLAGEEARCVPTEFKPLSVLELRQEGKVVLKNYDDMIIAECGCG